MSQADSEIAGLKRVGDYRRSSLRFQRALFRVLVGSDPQPTDAQVEEPTYSPNAFEVVVSRSPGDLAGLVK